MMRLIQAAVFVAILLDAGVASASDGPSGVDAEPSWHRPGVVFTGTVKRIDGHAIGAVVRSNGNAADRIIRFVQCPVSAEIGRYGCRTYEPDADDPADVTDGDVLRAVREMGLPRLSVRIQPGRRTLVNARTIFSTKPVAFDRSIELLGFDVDVQATPSSYTWHHGDGTSARTSEAGRPYPAFDVTHRYRAAADEVRPSVDVHYRVRYRVDGGAWRAIGPTLTAAGPASVLEVREAAPVLTAPVVEAP